MIMAICERFKSTVAIKKYMNKWNVVYQNSVPIRWTIIDGVIMSAYKNREFIPDENNFECIKHTAFYKFNEEEFSNWLNS